MYLSKLPTVFVQIMKGICLQEVSPSIPPELFSSWISNCQVYLSKLPNVFVQIAKCICPNCKMYLSQLLNVFVQIAKCIGSNSKMYLSQTLKCICLGWCESVGGRGVCLFVCPPGVGIAESSVSLFSVRQGSSGPAIVS